MILIFSIENDISTTAVVKLLEHYGQKVVVINSDDDTHKLLKINRDGIFFKNTRSEQVVNLMDATGCWWRRTGIALRNFTYGYSRKKFTADEYDLSDLVSQNKGLIQSEAKDLREYIFSKVYENCRINIGSPYRYRLNKLGTLDRAKCFGFKVPNYEIVTNLGQIANSKTIDDSFVSKAISEGIYHKIDGRIFYSYTELNKKAEFVGRNTPVFPSLIMNLINKKFEIRSFYLQGAFYSMAIFSQSSQQTIVDFRKYDALKPNRTEPYKLPGSIEDKLKALFKDLDLNCGSVDLIVDEDDDFVFLEINPVGQYQMTGEPCNYHLDDVIAKYLMHGT